MAETHIEEHLKRLWVRIGETLKLLRSTSASRWWLVWVSGGRKWVLGSSKATNVACSAVFDPDTNSAQSRQLGIEVFVSKAGFASEWLICTRLGSARLHVPIQLSAARILYFHLESSVNPSTKHNHE
jgi:hypothetical protein